MLPEISDGVSGLHHVTAVASDPQANVDFYTDVLGLRLVKKTINFDDPSTYHLYYGDEEGAPGTVLTFFPFGGGRRGRAGRGSTGATAFSIPRGAADYWSDRLDERGVDVDETEDRFGATVLPFEDDDGQRLELVEDDGTDIEPWSGGSVPAEHAIRGFHGVTLCSADAESTGAVLEAMGYEATETAGDRTRYATGGDRASSVDVLDRSDAPRARPGAGTVHHVAFRTADDETQKAWREHLTNAGLLVSPVKDRQYFHSIYFREPGGVLFEIATDGPGFALDEPVEELGSDLKLPPWMEDEREAIAGRLPEIEVRASAEASR